MSHPLHKQLTSESWVWAGRVDYIEVAAIEAALKELKAELKDEYGNGASFAHVYSTLKLVGERLGVVV